MYHDDENDDDYILSLITLGFLAGTGRIRDTFHILPVSLLK